MNDWDVDRELEKAVASAPTVSPTVLIRIAGLIRGSLRPVRPAPRPGVLTAALLLLCAALALGAAAWSGFSGFQARNVGQQMIMFPTLALLNGVVARELVGQWTPGSRHPSAPATLVAVMSAGVLGLFALLFADDHATDLQSQGVCLAQGVLQALAAACLATWLLRRRFVVSPVPAGTIAGMFGGLSGVAMLELHCPILEAPHVLVWHGAVVPVSAALGTLVGWRVSRRPPAFGDGR